MTIAVTEPRPVSGLSPRLRDGFGALAAGCFLLLFFGAGGFETLSDLQGDNDSLLRLVEIRDLIAGQGWFDLMQYRMGPEGGFAMHWSRLVDAPIALIILVATALTGSADIGEATALVLWPLMVFVVCLYFLLRAARSLGGEPAMLPALVIGAAALHFVGVFKPATLDHHNVQLALFFAMLALILEGGPLRSVAAGACAALMLAVGMETVPYVGVGGCAMALLFLLGNDDDAASARRFGVGFACTALLAFLATIPTSAWGVVQCDAYSVAQFGVAVLAGSGLAIAASFSALRSSLPRRLSALGLLAVGVAALVLTAFPQCLADPYASLDPRLKTYWLSLVQEAQPLWRLVHTDPAMVVSQYASPLFALLVLGVSGFRRGWRRESLIVGGFLVAAFLVSAWQVRGSTFSIVLAVLPLSAWVGRVRCRAETRPGRAASIMLIGAWLASFNISWAGGAIAVRMASAGSVEAGVAPMAESCTGAADFAALAKLPPSRLLAVSNIGAPILRYTPHSTFAGPYHRNVAGNLIALDAFMGSSEQAETIVRRHKVDFVVLCRGNDETHMLAEWAKDGFAAALTKGELPSWLAPVEFENAAGPDLYRVLPPSP